MDKLKMFHLLSSNSIQFQNKDVRIEIDFNEFGIEVLDLNNIDDEGYQITLFESEIVNNDTILKTLNFIQ